jgi:myosin heavy subunit
VLTTVAAVLHLGNIGFVQSIADDAELDDDLSWTSLGHVSELLQVTRILTLVLTRP